MARLSRLELGILIVVLAALFWLRMLMASSAEGLSYESYLTLRRVAHLEQTLTPMGDDPLSMAAARRSGSPFGDILLAVLVQISPMMYMVWPNLLMVLLLIPLYLLGKQLSGGPAGGLFAVILGATAPIAMGSYLITPSEIPLAIAVFLTILVLIDQPGNHLGWIIFLTVALTFLHPVSFLFTFALLVTILLLSIEGYGVDRRLGELFFFSLLLALWFHVLTYKHALAEDGLRIVWQNLPSLYALSVFGPVTSLSLLYALGVITFLFGLLGGYHVLFESRQRAGLPIIGSILTAFIALLLKAIPIRTGLLIISLLLGVLAARGLIVTFAYIAKTKFPWTRHLLGAGVIFLLVVASILPGLANANDALADTPRAEDIAGYVALGELDDAAVILTDPHESAAVQYYARRTTVVDEDFLSVDHPDELIADIDMAYTARFSSTIVNLADKWGYTHILFTPRTAERYARTSLLVDECVRATSLTPEMIVYEITCGRDA